MTAPRPATPGGTTTPERHPGRAVGRTLALALLLFVTVLLVLFVVFNTQTVDISLVFGNVQAPLVLALVIAAALGGLLVGLAGLVVRARRRDG
ncbi:MAG: LapA family protein [Actinomycetota bacterium]|nr:LapA family protein [Actinomycetota bacterium]